MNSLSSLPGAFFHIAGAGAIGKVGAAMVVSALRRKLTVCAPYETLDAALVEVTHSDGDHDSGPGWYVELRTKDALGKTRTLGLFPVDMQLVAE